MIHFDPGGRTVQPVDLVARVRAAAAEPLLVDAAIAPAAALMALTPQQPSVFGEYLAFILVAYTVAERLRLSLAVLAGLVMAGGILAHDTASTDFNTDGA